MSVASVINQIKEELPAEVTLVAVSKYHPAEMVQEAYEAGQRVFGESHEQELSRKQPVLPQDIKWHFIGHLQTNKVKFIAPYVSLIHSVDTPHLLKEISKQGVKCGRQIPCLLQLHVAAEETKFGFTPEECLEYLATGEWHDLSGVSIQGIMCMATNTDSEERIRADFRKALETFRRVKELYFPDDDKFCIRSWGMSDDYPIAVEEGSNMVRIGTKIFGPRVY